MLTMKKNIEQYKAVILLEALNPIIKKGMKGCILEVWDDNMVEVEFIKPDGTNYEFKGGYTFAIAINKLKIVD